MDWTGMLAGQLLLGSGLRPGLGGGVQPVLAGGVVAEIVVVVVAVGTVETVAVGVVETVVEIVVEVAGTAEIDSVETVVALRADVFLGQSCWAILPVVVVVGTVGIEVLAVGIVVEAAAGFD